MALHGLVLETHSSISVVEEREIGREGEKEREKEIERERRRERERESERETNHHSLTCPACTDDWTPIAGGDDRSHSNLCWNCTIQQLARLKN